MSKGITLCQSAVLTTLIVIGVIAFFYWLLFSRFFDLHVYVSESEVERRTITMANVLLSYKGLIPTPSTTSVFLCEGTPKGCNEFDSDKNGCENQLGCSWCGCREYTEGIPGQCLPDKPEGDCHGCWGSPYGPEHCYSWVGCQGTPKPCDARDEGSCGTPSTTGCSRSSIVSTVHTSTRGVFDKTKLDQLTTYLEHPDDSTYATALQDAVNNAQEWDIGYPNSYTTFVVIDLETCSDTCNGWVGAFKGPFSVNAMYASKFVDCLANNIDLSAGSVFRGAIFGPLTLWQPWDLAKCWQNTLSQSTEKIFFGYTSIPSISSGYPVLIRYPSGELHVGRLLVGVWQWA